MTVERADPADAEAARAFFDGLDAGLAARVVGRHGLAVVERDGARWACLATRELLALPKELLAGAEAGGLPLGTLDDNAFRIDLQGGFLAARHTRNQTVRVNEHASQLFLYGRNVLGDSVEWHDGTLEKGDACIVTNPRGEGIGIGRVVGSFKGTRAAVSPLHDLGAYLRDEGGRDEAD